MRPDLELIRECDATDPAPSASFTLCAEVLPVVAELDEQIAQLRDRRNDLAAAVTKHLAVVAPEHRGLLVKGKAVFVHVKRSAQKCDDVKRLVSILAARISEKAFAEDRPPAAVGGYIAEEMLRCAGVIPQTSRDKERPWGTYADWRSKRVRLHWPEYDPREWMSQGDEYLTFDIVSAREEE